MYTKIRQTNVGKQNLLKLKRKLSESVENKKKEKA